MLKAKHFNHPKLRVPSRTKKTSFIPAIAALENGHKKTADVRRFWGIIFPVP